jgi:DNA modification methylase
LRKYYEDSYVTLYHGDCREVLPSLPSVDLLLTDPPYGIGFAAQPTKWQRLDGEVPQAWDDDVVDMAVLDSARAKARTHIVWGGNHYPLPPSRCWFVWTKPDSPPSMGSAEFAWTNMDRCSRHVSHSIGATNAERVGHPTQKPLAVIAWCLAQVPEARTVLDPFAGSGTTLRAAKDRGLHAIGIEIEERYCEIAARRMAQEVLALA